MNKTSGTAAVAMVAAMMVAPTANADDIPNREMWADRYLSAVCPSNAAGERVAKQWNKAYDGRRIVPWGTPTTPGLRKAFQRKSKAEARAGMRFARWNWPDEIANPAARLARGFYHDSGVWQIRAEYLKVRRPWGKYADTGSAATTMRIALGLPPANSADDGC